MIENAPDVISVAELDRRLKLAVEDASAKEWVQGEVGSLRRAASGHVYFTLKDENEDAIVDCVMYRFHALRARQHLLEGGKLQIRGRATVWAPRGRLQFIAEMARPLGRGAQLEAFERLKEKLMLEGLFASEKKRRLPPSPHCIGVVTSLHGAAIHDIRVVSARRARVKLVVASALVQGDGAVESLLAALNLIDRDSRVEVVIVGRGGGSTEDLMAFNDERVVRRLAAMRVPTVSAVGHETDLSLCDLVADMRAATPSHAAEIVVADERRQEEQLRHYGVRLERAMRSRLEEDRVTGQRLRALLSDPRFLIAERQQYLDDLSWRAERVMRRRLAKKRSELEARLQRLSAVHPRVVIADARTRLGPIEARLRAGMRIRLQQAAARLGSSAAQLDALSPLTVLARGYAIATCAGEILRSSSQVHVGDHMELRLAQGTLAAAVTRVNPE